MDKTVNFKINLSVKGKDTLHSISIDAEDFREAVRTSVDEAQKLGGTLKNLTQQGMIFSGLKDTLDVLNNAIGSLADTYDDFDEAMRAVNTMADKDGAGFKILKEQVEDLAKTVPLAKNEIAQGLYQVISNGVPEDNWISYLQASARSAVGGIADLGETVTVTSTIIKNYGLEWNTAASIQDKIQMTAKNGVTTFEQLAQALPRVSGNAATLGVSIDELMATFATLTGVSGNTAEVSTQLAAVFTALVKPSGEATEMARAMGVEFDAAAIKAAGGMSQFLTKLSIDITRYASATGTLEQEIYGKLFGSAEALRALIPLTGELSQKFVENIGAMADSTGIIDQAFESMSGSGRSVQQRLKNIISTFTDFAGSVASTIRPWFTLLASFGQGLYGFSMLWRYLKNLIPALNTLTIAQIRHNAVAALSAVHTKVQAVAHSLLTVAQRTATISTKALTAATVGLYAAMTLGISLAIQAIVTMLSKLSNKADEASQSVDSLSEASKAYNDTVTEAKSDISMEITSLTNLMKSNRDTAAAVENLNSKYGDIFGSHATAAEWYDTLVAKSEAYCRQLGYEAQAKVIASKKAEKELRLEQIAAEKKTMENAGTATITMSTHHGAQDYSYTQTTRGYQKLIDEEKTLTSETEELQTQFSDCMQKMADSANELAANTTTLGGVADAVDITKMSYEELSKAIEDNEKKLASLKPTDTAQIATLKSRNKELKQQQESVAKLLGIETKQKGNDGTHHIINTVSDIKSMKQLDEEIAYQQNLYQNASKEKAALIDQEIQRLTALKTTFEQSLRVNVPIDQISTYKQLNDEISYQQQLMETAGPAERAQIQMTINKLNDIKKSWDNALKDKPEDISRINTLESISNAVSYYQDQQQTASAEEYEGLQRTIDALNKKRAAIEGLASIPASQAEVTALSGLSGEKLQLQLEVIGVEGIKNKISDLQSLLDGTVMTDEQRKEVNALIASWTGYEHVLTKSQIRFTDAWSSVKGVGSSVESMTNALEGNGSAWQKVTSVMDGFIGIHEGIQKIISIIQALTTATNAQTVATEIGTVAKETDTAAEVVGSVEKVAASGAATVAKEAETAANIKAAVSGFFAAHAAIPFVGAAIAGAGIALLLAKMTSLPKFAAGGIAYGPTLGLFGEYSGASHNPEVVAPLDKLKSLIGIPETSVGGQVTFRIDGRTLVGVLEKENNIRRRS